MDIDAVHLISYSCLMITDAAQRRNPTLTVIQRAIKGILVRCVLVVVPTPWKSVKTSLALWWVGATQGSRMDTTMPPARVSVGVEVRLSVKEGLVSQLKMHELAL